MPDAPESTPRSIYTLEPHADLVTAENGYIPIESIAFIGDDLPDIGALQVVGLPVAVANATIDAFRVARYRLSRRGGDGAVREFAQTLLTVRGQWEPLVQNYVSSREQALPTI